MNKKRLIIVAIDGGNFQVINPLLEKNILPNLASFKHKSPLISVIPPATSVAWASFLTGNNPGKTGIYDFTIVDEDSWNVDFLNRNRLKGKPLWQYLTEANIKSCFMNLPVTFPPEKLNGVIISGIETPSKYHNYTYPPDLKDELKQLGYEIEVSGLKDKKEEIVKEALYIFEKRLTAVEHMLKKNFDFFIILFRVTDIVQHFAWNKNPVTYTHKKIDELVGKLKQDKNNEIIVMSDHGIEKISKAFNANAWLEKEGYLKTNLKKSLLSSLGIKRQKIYNIIDKLKLNFIIRYIPRSLGKKIPDENINFEEALTTGIVDLKKTRAIAKRAVKSAQIFLNTEKRGGIVKKEQENNLKKEIKSKLLKFFEKKEIEVIVKTKEELYGKSARYAPDITIYMKENEYETHCFFSSDKEIWVNPRKEDAEHNLNGVIFTDLPLNLEKARIIDLAPTILKYFNINYNEEDFDGKSLLIKD